MLFSAFRLGGIHRVAAGEMIMSAAIRDLCCVKAVKKTSPWEYAQLPEDRNLNALIASPAVRHLKIFFKA